MTKKQRRAVLEEALSWLDICECGHAAAEHALGVVPPGIAVCRTYCECNRLRRVMFSLTLSTETIRIAGTARRARQS